MENAASKIIDSTKQSVELLTRMGSKPKKHFGEREKDYSLRVENYQKAIALNHSKMEIDSDRKNVDAIVERKVNEKVAERENDIEARKNELQRTMANEQALIKKRATELAKSEIERIQKEKGQIEKKYNSALSRNRELNSDLNESHNRIEELVVLSQQYSTLLERCILLDKDKSLCQKLDEQLNDILNKNEIEHPHL